MKEFLLSALIGAFSLGSISAQTIYAYRCFQESNAQFSKKGPVKYSVSDPKTVTLIADQTKLGSVYAGAYYNYKWYAQVTQLGTQKNVDGFYTIDMNDGTRTLISKQGAHLGDMTYDYTTNTMYGLKSDNETLVTVDLNTGATTTVGYFKTASYQYPYILTLAADINGQLYAIGTDDNLYAVDKTNAIVTLIGSTGVDAAFAQSMDFDHSTGTLYWANNGDCTLYTVDVKTGVATAVGAIGAKGDDSTNAMIIPFINVAKGAPDRVTGRSATADGKSVVLKWTNPAIDAQGNALTEITGVNIYRNNELATTVAMTADQIGKEVTYTDTNLTDGLFNYRIVAVNSKGEGGADTETIGVYVGQNNPGAVNNFSIALGDNSATLSWEAPTSGMYGGEYDVNSVTSYIITRTKGTTVTEITVNDGKATSYTDEPGFGTYTYSIAAVNALGKGQVTTANPVVVKPASWIVMTTGETIVESGKEYKFYDVAGPDAYYPNSQNDTLTIRPAASNAIVTAKFSLFDFDTYADSLIVFNGTGTKDLIGRYSATSVPSDLVELESSSADGALTFVFFSDIMSRGEGWVADVTAAEKLKYDLVAGALSGNLYPEEKTAATFSFKVRNKGTENVAGASYKVQLLDDKGNVLDEKAGVDIASAQDANIELSFTPDAKGEIKLKAKIIYEADLNSANNASAEIAVTVLAAGSRFVEVGQNDEELYVLPVSFMSDEAVGQTIYRAEEIGVENMELTMIAYPFAAVTNNYANVPLKVWVSETDSTTLLDGSIPASKMTLVFDGNCPISKTESEWAIPFTTPYQYKGGNLVIMVHKVAPNTDGMDVKFRGTFGDYENENKRSRFQSTYSETEHIDVNATIAYSASTMVADIKMLFASASGISEVTIGGNVKVFPNPATEVIYIENEAAKAQLFSLAGQQVFEGENVSSIDVKDMPAGIYMLRTTDAEGNIASTKIVKK